MKIRIETKGGEFTKEELKELERREPARIVRYSSTHPLTNIDWRQLTGSSIRRCG